MKMSGENNKPWYKKPEIMVILIAAIIAAISAIVAAYIGIIPDIDHGFATVQGIVTDNNGKPVIGALVEIDGLSDRTGSDGGYVIRGVPINTKTITVRVSGVEVVKYALRVSEDTDVLSYDITLPPPVTLSITPYPTDHEPKPFATVQGIVTDNNGKPVIGALVEIDGLSDRTGSDGGYVIRGVPINTKTITVRVSGVEVVKYALRVSEDTDVLSYDITLPSPKSTPTPTPPTPEPEPVPEPTPEPVPVPVPVPVPEPEPVPEPTPEPVPVPEPTPEPVPEPTPEPVPEPTPEPEPGPTPIHTSTVTIKIAEPKDGDTVFDDPVIVSGTVKNFTNDVLSLWACVKSYDGIWYPQESLTMTGEETWEADTRPGIPTEPADIGKKFDIVVLVAAEEVDKELRKTLRGEGDIADGWGLSALPEGVNILDQITVIRG
ncbi:TonB-like protein [Methanophagales archaeon]|nr:TonB-like protein [Methanophagales archaeon]